MSDLPFWKTVPLKEMSNEQWESLCDQCGRCCLHKLEDEDTGELHYTNVVCRMYDMKTCECSDYKNRFKHVDSCLKLSPDFIPVDWLPQTCAYRLLEEGKDLPEWHPLLNESKGKNKKTALAASGMSLKGKILPEDWVDDEALEDHIIAWVK